MRWLIIGAGVHGVHLAVRLVAEVGVDPQELVLVDPEPSPLARWGRCAATCGMTFLRSPGVHHLDVEPFALQDFAAAHGLGADHFRQPYARPSLELFDRHAQHVLDHYRLRERHRVGRVVDLAPGEREVRATLADGEVLRAERVILAMGASDAPCWPDWAGRRRVSHVFDPQQPLDLDALPSQVLVVGGGLSAVQVALRVADTGREVSVLSRHPLREFEFDSDPGWMGPKNMVRFQRLDPEARRRTIQAERHRGSVPHDAALALRRALAAGRVRWVVGTPVAATRLPRELRVVTREGALSTQRLLLATGFAARRPGGAWVDALARALPCAPCGYPLPGPELRWHPRVVVTGPLAELELGPVARNVIGARRAGDRLVPWAKRAA